MFASLADISSISHSLFSPIWCSYISLSSHANVPIGLRLTRSAS